MYIYKVCLGVFSILRSKPSIQIKCRGFWNGMTWSLLMVEVSAFSWSAKSSANTCMFDWNFIFSIITFSFLLYFHFHWLVLSFHYVFKKLSLGMITGRHGVNTITCFAVCAWTENWITNVVSTDTLWCKRSLTITRIIYIVTWELMNSWQCLYLMR